MLIVKIFEAKQVEIKWLLRVESTQSRCEKAATRDDSRAYVR